MAGKHAVTMSVQLHDNYRRASFIIKRASPAVRHLSSIYGVCVPRRRSGRRRATRLGIRRKQAVATGASFRPWKLAWMNLVTVTGTFLSSFAKRLPSSLTATACCDIVMRRSEPGRHFGNEDPMHRPNGHLRWKIFQVIIDDTMKISM